MSSHKNSKKTGAELVLQAAERLLKLGRIKEALGVFSFAISLGSIEKSPLSNAQIQRTIECLLALMPFHWQPPCAKVRDYKQLLLRIPLRDKRLQATALLGLAQVEIEADQLTAAEQTQQACLRVTQDEGEAHFLAQLGIGAFYVVSDNTPAAIQAFGELFRNTMGANLGIDLQRIISASALLHYCQLCAANDESQETAQTFLRHYAEQNNGSMSLMAKLSLLKNQTDRRSTTRAEREVWRKLTELPEIDLIAVMTSCRLASRWINRGIRRAYADVIGYLQSHQWAEDATSFKEFPAWYSKVNHLASSLEFMGDPDGANWLRQIAVIKGTDSGFDDEACRSMLQTLVADLHTYAPSVDTTPLLKLQNFDDECIHGTD